MIQIENTPNPNALKFLSENQLSEVETQEFQKKDLSQIKNEFVKNILKFEGVELVLISKDFMSVKKMRKLVGILLSLQLFHLLMIILKKIKDQ